LGRVVSAAGDAGEDNDDDKGVDDDDEEDVKDEVEGVIGSGEDGAVMNSGEGDKEGGDGDDDIEGVEVEEGERAFLAAVAAALTFSSGLRFVLTPPKGASEDLMFAATLSAAA
jgi:hypothetical protein